jgi:hypothetical protein
VGINHLVKVLFFRPKSKIPRPLIVSPIAWFSKVVGDRKRFANGTLVNAERTTNPVARYFLSMNKSDGILCQHTLFLPVFASLTDAGSEVGKPRLHLKRVDSLLICKHALMDGGSDEDSCGAKRSIPLHLNCMSCHQL